MDTSNTSLHSDTSAGSSPVASPQTDTMQYAAFHDTQGDWHDMTCSPSNCVINTISPHTPFSPHQDTQEPPTIRYIPRFDDKVNQHLSPLSYPSPNMTFFNPYLASRSCKRALDTSNSSAGSLFSPHRGKRARENLSWCSGSQDRTLDQTCVASDATDRDDSTSDTTSLVCESCPDLLAVVAVCRTCPDQPPLCQLCLDAHKRVRVTRDHVIHILGEQGTQPCYRSVPQILENIVELLDVDLDDSIAAATAELLRTWDISLEKFSEKQIAHDMKHSEEIIEANMVPVFSRGNASVKLKAVTVMKKLIELKVVNVSAAFTSDKCIEGFEEMIISEDSEVVAAALDCLQCLVKGIALLGAKFSLIKLHSKLEKQLKRLKMFEAGYTTCVQFKASKLIREMEKCLME